MNGVATWPAGQTGAWAGESSYALPPVSCGLHCATESRTPPT